MSLLGGRVVVKSYRHFPKRHRSKWGHRIPTVLHRHAFDFGPFTIFWGRRLDPLREVSRG